MSIVFQILQSNHLPALVDLWNNAAKNNYGFFPLTKEKLSTHLATAPDFSPEKIIVANYSGTIVGMLHYDIVDVAPYPRAGVICALIIHPDYRGRGFAQALLREAIERLTRQSVDFIDALGSWPYSSFYVGLIDGSERAGVDATNEVTLYLLEKFRFKRERESIRMQMALVPATSIKEEEITDKPGDLIYCHSRAGKKTWLDKCFRHWTSYDHILLNERGGVLSQAVYARMNDFSEYGGREMYAMYGVNTPAYAQRRGYAKKNLLQIKKRLAELRGEILEIHVYADNASAIKLYQRCDFHEVGKNFMYRFY